MTAPESPFIKASVDVNGNSEQFGASFFSVTALLEDPEEAYAAESSAQKLQTDPDKLED